ncbi:MAG: hypothetical protein PHD05_01545 [Sphaerochaetaceae bacterium]|jgi:hypothetical protein|nr:hypothetical protein [Sphaerochaetaceae bacterium]
MATSNKLLGNSKPTAETATLLYTVPVATQANVNLFICNQAAVADTIRLALSHGSLLPGDYILYDHEVKANSSMQITGIALAATDFITIYSTNGTCSFVATGIEIN